MGRSAWAGNLLRDVGKGDDVRSTQSNNIMERINKSAAVLRNELE
jgi:hypothetical protein